MPYVDVTAKYGFGAPSRKLAAQTSRQPAPTPKTKAIVREDDHYSSLFQRRTRNVEQVRKWQTIYEQGGIITQAINCFPEYMLMNCIDGFELWGEEEAQVDYCYQMLEEFDAYSVFWQQIVNSLVTGAGLGEIVCTKGGIFHSIYPRDPSYFDVKLNDAGHIIEYRQYDDDIRETYTPISPSQILHNTLISKTDSPWGMSLIGLAYDEIMRDTKTAESIANGIERHGSPKWHVVIGEEDQEVSKEDLKKSSNEFRKINSKHEFTTRRDVEIKPLDAGGMANVREYSEATLARLAAAVGVPEELMGLGRGSTEATATVKEAAFAKKIKPMQKRFIYQIYHQWFRPELESVFGSSVSPVYLKLGEIVPEDLDKKASVFQRLMPQYDPFLIFHRDEIRDAMGYSPYEDSAFYTEEPELPDLPAAQQKDEDEPEEEK